MTELLRHPRKELREIVRKGEHITEDDLIEMHYLKAVMKETLRLHPPVPLLVPRIAAQDVEIGGYKINAKTHFAMAVNEIALANIVHKFDWALPGGASGEDLDMTESTGVTAHKKDPLRFVAIPYLF
ncbi:hypothetical protein DVH24_039700 [Malus domestica]|uniref:Cytochrome P450 n=1 Tax=Malus domestica TaxID=3750 RepID=A0A498I4A6_MALDO|nr:hypothetical protein DVH24_039700 [Malus domestica]